MASVFYVDYYLPKKRITVQDVIKEANNFILPSNFKTNEEYCIDFCSQSKMNKISIEESQDHVDIFSNMISKFFDKTKINPDDINCMIYADPKNSYAYPDINSEGRVIIPYYLQKKYKLSNASIIISNQQCITTIWSIGMAQKLLLGTIGKYVIIISSNFLKNMEDRNMGFAIGGDGAGIIAIKSDMALYEVVDYNFLSDGTASFNSYCNIKKKINKFDNIIQQVKAIKCLLGKNKLRMNDIFGVIPQNINYCVYVNVYGKMLNLETKKMFLDNIPNGGHCGDVDIIRNLADFLNKYQIPKGSYILLFGMGAFGEDFNYGAVLLKSTN
ncbi:hypothetical protein [Clostridium sp.]|uniref:hypothetical protein n=1 Tax=Clostridium sp. TaxID=1506 RepID=UPI002624CB9D|nr:hypothetical protein [Clostridium sp.]